MKFKVWLDSGANIHSRYEQEIEIDDMSEEEFNSMSDEEKDEMFKEYAWSRMDWGWVQVEE